MLKGAGDDREGDDVYDDDDDLDSKTAELERKLKSLLVENEQIERDKAKAQRTHNTLEKQVTVLQVMSTLSGHLESTQGPSKRYEEMRRRKDRKEGKLTQAANTKTTQEILNKKQKPF